MVSATYAALWRNLQAETNVDQLICEIIGQSQISSARLPTEPQVSHIQQTRKLLLRLKWILDSQRVSLLRSSLVTAAPIERQFLLRVISHVMLLAGCNKTSQERNIDYLVFRRIALEALLSAVSLYLLSQSPFTLPEEDVFQSQLQQLVEGWKEVEPLSETDSIIANKIIPAAFTAHQDGGVEVNWYPRAGTVENAIATNFTETPHPLVQEHIRKSIDELAATRHYPDWIGPCLGMYNTITEVHQLLFLNNDQGDKSKILMEYCHTLLSSMPELVALGESTEDFTRMSQYLLEMLSSGIYMIQNTPKQERVFESSLSDRMGRIIKAEMMEFDQFYCHRFDRILSARHSPVPSSLSFALSERSQEYEYGRVNTPVSKSPSIQAYSPVGPRTSVQSQSPMTMDEILFVKAELADSPGSTTVLPISPSSSIKRKPLPVPEIAHRVQEDTNHPESYQNAVILAEENTQRPVNVSPPAYHFISPKPCMKTEYNADLYSETEIYQTPYSETQDEPQQDTGAELGSRIVSETEPDPSSPRKIDRGSKLHTEIENNQGAGITGNARPVLSSDPDPTSLPIPVLADADTSSRMETLSIAAECTLELVTDLTNSKEADYSVFGSNHPLWSPISPHSPAQRTEIESGLEVVPWRDQNSARSSAPVEPEELPTIQPDGMSLRPSIRSGRSFGKSKFRLFKGLGGSNKTPLVDSAPPLPPKLGFCFSMCGQILLLWSKKDNDFVVRINHPFESGKRLDLRMSHESHLPPSNHRKGFSIRFVAATLQLVAAFAHIDKERRLHVITAAGKQHAVLFNERMHLAMALSIRPDGKMVVIGFASSIHVYTITNDELQKTSELEAQTVHLAGSIRFQRLNFATDSSKLISAIQVSLDTNPRQAVYIRVWDCSGTNVRDGYDLDPVHLTVGYGDDSGVTSVFYSDIQITKFLLAASISKSYPAIIFQSKQFRNHHLDVVDKRIDSAAQCGTASSSHLFAIQSGRHKIFALDLQTEVTRQLADFSSERKNLPLGQEAMAIGMDDENSVYAFWRTADDRLVLRKMEIQGRDSTSRLVDLTALYKRLHG